MAIVKQPPGMAGLYGRAAAITGESQKAMRQAEEARRAAQQMQAIQLQQAREERGYQRQLESEERSHQWEVEKMDMRSRVDFTEEERARQEKRANFQATIKRIDEIENITKETKEDLRTKAVVDFLGISVSDRVLFPELHKKEEARKRVPSRTDVGAALEFLAEVEEKEKSWEIPWISREPPTEEERAAVPYYQDILRRAGMGAGEAGRAAVSMAPVEQDVNINVRPNNIPDFDAITAQIYSIDPEKARTYFDKWKTLFPGEYE